MMVFAVIPAYNEEKNIVSVVKGLKKQVKKVIVVDDGSTDRTRQLAQRAGATLVNIKKNQGKGNAMRLGAKKAIEMGAEAVFFLDSDGQHDPLDLRKFKDGLKDADAVFGYRAGKKPWFKKIGNGLADFGFAILFGRRIKDVLCGYRAFKAGKIPCWRENRYFVEIEMAELAVRGGLKIKQVPVKTTYPKNVHRSLTGIGYKGMNIWHSLETVWKLLSLRIKVWFGRREVEWLKQ